MHRPITKAAAILLGALVLWPSAWAWSQHERLADADPMTEAGRADLAEMAFHLQTPALVPSAIGDLVEKAARRRLTEAAAAAASNVHRSIARWDDFVRHPEAVAEAIAAEHAWSQEWGKVIDVTTFLDHFGQFRESWEFSFMRSTLVFEQAFKGGNHEWLDLCHDYAGAMRHVTHVHSLQIDMLKAWCETTYKSAVTPDGSMATTDDQTA